MRRAQKPGRHCHFVMHVSSVSRGVMVAGSLLSCQANAWPKDRTYTGLPTCFAVLQTWLESELGTKDTTRMREQGAVLSLVDTGLGEERQTPPAPVCCSRGFSALPSLGTQVAHVPTRLPCVLAPCPVCLLQASRKPGPRGAERPLTLSGHILCLF